MSSRSAFICGQCRKRKVRLNIESYLQEVKEYLAILKRSEEQAFTDEARKSILFLRSLEDRGEDYLYYCQECAIILTGTRIFILEYAGVN